MMFIIIAKVFHSINDNLMQRILQCTPIVIINCTVNSGVSEFSQWRLIKWRAFVTKDCDSTKAEMDVFDLRCLSTINNHLLVVHLQYRTFSNLNIVTYTF